MLTEVYHNIYLSDCPLPNSPLRTINVFIIKGEDRNIIIDTGFCEDACRKALFDSLHALSIDLKKTDLFLTHLHPDHSGLAAELYQQGATVHASPYTAEYLNNMVEPEFWPNRVRRFEKLIGMEPGSINVYELQPYKYRYLEKIPIQLICEEESSVLKSGEYTFEVINFHGHEPGQIALYERKHRLIFSGDHILNEISPNIGSMDTETDFLRIYCENLYKMRNMNISQVFSAHRSQIKNHRDRIDELLTHHKKRLEETANILNEDTYTVRQVAGKMSWRIKADSFDAFPSTQKWFAVTEAMAHLEWLRHHGYVNREEKNGIFYYSLN